MATRKTTQQFIEEAKKVHGDKYDYSKVEYINVNTKVCIICPEHGEFWQTPISHLKGKYGCKKCFIESQKGSNRRNPWTKEEIIEKAKNYKYLADFVKENQGAYDKARRLGILDLLNLKRKRKDLWTKEEIIEKAKDYEYLADFREENKGMYRKALELEILNLLNLKRKNNLKKRGIYSYIFEYKNKKYVYVGLTYNFSERDLAHRSQAVKSSVYKFAKEYNLEIPEQKIEHDYIDVNIARELEGEVLKKYIDKGYIPINKVKTGTTGSIRKKEYTHEELIEKSSHFISLTEWEKGDHRSYEYARKKGIHRNYIKSKYEEWKNISFEELLNNAKKYKTRTEWRQNNTRYYNIADYHGYMDKITIIMGWKKIYKPVQQIDLITNEVINEFESIHAAARFMNMRNHTSISRAAKGLTKENICKGYKWKFKEN